MRMWKVNPKLLCRQHLLGEHREMHALIGILKKHGITRLKGYIDKGLVEVHNIFTRHYDLAMEIIHRGYNHKSPLYDYTLATDIIGSVDEKANLIELAKRCNECKKLQKQFNQNI